MSDTFAVRDFEVTWREDGTACIVGRLAGPDGTGAATGISGEGNWVKQTDVSAMTYQVLDITDEDDVVEVVAATSITVSAVLVDTPVTNRALWATDATGYNFRHNLPATCFPTAGHRYKVRYKMTYSGGSVGWGVAKGEALGN